MTARPAKSKNERMLQSLIVEVCGKEAKGVVRAAMRAYKEKLAVYSISDLIRLSYSAKGKTLIRACARYDRAKARAKGK